MNAEAEARIEAIKTAIVNHGRWLRHKGGRRADLSFQDLGGFNLDRLDLSGAKMTGANLAKARLRGANLSTCDLFGADLEDCDLSGANMSGADLRGANMNRCSLADANLRGADFRAGEVAKSDGSGVLGGTTSLVEAKMERSILAGAYLTGCDLTGADLVDADLSGAELTQAIMIGVDLQGANMKGATLKDTVADVHALAEVMRGTLPPGAVAEPAYAEVTAEWFLDAVAAHELWAESQGAEGRRLDLDLTAVPPVDLEGRQISGARLRRSRFSGGNWRGVDLQMADLSYATLSAVELSSAVLSGANFRRATLVAVTMRGTRCQPFLFGGGRSWPTNFDGANLTKANMEGALLDGAILPKGFGAGPPESRPSKERRRHARYESPVLNVTINGLALRTSNWSIGGMSLEGGEAFHMGDRLGGTVSIAGHQTPDARADMVIVHMNRAKGLTSVRFEGLSQDMKVLLKQAFTLNQRGG